MLREWLLSRQCQLAAQAVVGVLTAAVFSVARPLQFPHACLAPVFVVIITTSLAQDQHVGSRVQVTALLLGPTWLAVLLAVALMTLAKLAEDPSDPHAPGYVVAATLLALLGLAVLVLVRAAAPAGPARLMGMLSTVVYGIMVLLSEAHPGLQGLLTGAVGYVLLAVVLASAVSLAAGLLVAPSLATDEVARLTAQALQGAGSILSYHTSLLLAEQHQQAPASKHQQTDAGSSGQGQDKSIAVHAAPARPAPAAANLRKSSTSSNGCAAVAVAAAACLAAAREHGNATLDWVPDNVDAPGQTASAGTSGKKTNSGMSSRSFASNSSSSTCSASKLASTAAAQVPCSQDTCGALDDKFTGAAQQIQLLDVQLLQAVDVAAGSQDHDTVRADLTAAWVAAASRQRSLLLPEGSQDIGSPSASARLSAVTSSEHAHAVNSLEHAASLDFQPEADDEALLQAMRSLSKSKPYGSTTSLCHLQQQQQQQQEGRQQNKYPRSAASVMSVAGSFLERLSMPVLERRSMSALDQPLTPTLGRRSLPAYERPSRPVLQRHSLSFTGSASAERTAAGVPAAAGAAAASATWQGRAGSSGVRAAGSNGTDSSTGLQVPSEDLSHPFAGPASRGQIGGSLQYQSTSDLTSDLHDAVKHKSRLGSYLRQLRQTSTGRLSVKLQHSRQASELKQQRSGALQSCVSWADLHVVQVQSSGTPAATVPEAPQHQTTGSWSHSLQQAAANAGVKQLPKTTAEVPDCNSQTAAVHGAGSITSAGQQAKPVIPAVFEQAAPATAAQLGLLIGRAKALLAAARLEPAWLRPKGMRGFGVDAWGALLEDAELLLVRVSTLEALSDERRLQGLQLHHLQHYRDIADAMSMTLAQLAAFLAHVSEALKQQQASHHVSPLLARLARRVYCALMLNPWPTAGKGLVRQQHARVSQVPLQLARELRTTPGVATAHGIRSPFAATSARESQGRVKADDAGSGSQDVVSWSAVLSGLERQGSGVSSYLWEKKAGWETGRQLLQREMEAAVGGYWWAVRTASRQAPVQVPNSREVMTLTFIWPITNGLLDSLERVEASAQRVLSSTKPKQQQKQGIALGASSSSNSKPWADGEGASSKVVVVNKLLSWMSCLLYKQQHRQLHASTADVQQGRLCGRCTCFAGVWSWLQAQQQWVTPLLALLTVQPGLQAVKHVLLHDLPAALKSREGLRRLLLSRTFQAGMKLYLAMGSTLVVTMVLMAYVPAVRDVAPIFGFTSVCLSMQERVEATADKVVGRVLGTILGACLGLAITQVPNVFHAPVLLLACIGAASVPLSILARAEARVALALALITLLAVSLCTYEMACCTPGPHMGAVEVFLARLGAVVGACIYVALLNQLILPWYTSDYALEQMADALQQAAALFEKIYLSQYNRMRMAAVAAGAMVDGAEPSTAPVSGEPAGNTAPHGADSLQVGIQSAPGAVSTGRPADRVRKSLDLLRSPEKALAQAALASAAAQDAAGPLEAAAVELAALEAAEAGLHVELRHEVLRRLVDVQLSLAKESVSWKSGVLATPQVVFDVLGAMVELVEALACQRLALAPFTRQPASAAAGMGAAAGGTTDGSMPGGLLRVSGHCFSVWAQPLHPLWMEVLTAVQDLTHATVRQLRNTRASAAAMHAGNSSADELLAKLSRLEAARLELRRGWLAIRTNLHKHVHAGSMSMAPASTGTDLCRLPAGVRFWPIDSVHFFTFTYGASRVLNKLAGVAQTLSAAQHQPRAQG